MMGRNTVQHTFGIYVFVNIGISLQLVGPLKRDAQLLFWLAI